MGRLARQAVNWISICHAPEKERLEHSFNMPFLQFALLRISEVFLLVQFGFTFPPRKQDLKGSSTVLCSWGYLVFSSVSDLQKMWFTKHGVLAIYWTTQHFPVWFICVCSVATPWWLRWLAWRYSATLLVHCLQTWNTDKWMQTLCCSYPLK